MRDKDDLPGEMVVVERKERKREKEVVSFVSA
jgi:hypothetical protein